MEESSSQANEIIGRLSEILEKILSHSDLKSLNQAATVNKLWNEIATHEMRLRRQRPRIIVMQSMPISEVRDYVETVNPQVAFFFVNKLLWSKKDLISYRSCFPNHMVVVPTRLVMLDEKRISSMYNQVLESNDQSARHMISLLIPQYGCVRIRAAYDADLPERMADSRDDTLNRQFLNEFLPKNTRSKATFIIFGRASYKHTSILKLLKEKMEKRQQEYTIWGAAFNTTPFTKEEFDDPLYGFFTKNHGIFAMSITGSSLKSSSILISCYDSKLEFDAKLKDFRNQLHLKQHSIGLLCGPECDFNNKTLFRFELDSLVNAVKRIFPDVPIVGLYDYDGTHCYGLNSTTDDLKQKLEHVRSFSLMILTYDD